MNDIRPLISIMMPVYNGMSTLDLAVSSLLQQTYPNWRCIIVNDGSDDGTREFLDALTDPRFVVLHFEQNMGRPYARQAALDLAEGEYLAFLDADDFYHPEKLERQVELLSRHQDVDLVSCGNASYNGNFDILTVRGCGRGESRSYKYGEQLGCALRTSLIRLSLAKDVSFNMKLKHAQDTDFLQRYLNGRRYIAMPYVLYYYSEFVSVTGRKILRTYYYSLIHSYGLLKHAFAANLRAIALTVAKASVTVVLLPFVDVDFFLKKRGRIPQDAEVLEFKKVCSTINKAYRHA